MMMTLMMMILMMLMVKMISSHMSGFSHKLITPPKSCPTNVLNETHAHTHTHKLKLKKNGKKTQFVLPFTVQEALGGALWLC